MPKKGVTRTRTRPIASAVRRNPVPLSSNPYCVRCARRYASRQRGAARAYAVAYCAWLTGAGSYPQRPADVPLGVAVRLRTCLWRKLAVGREPLNMGPKESRLAEVVAQGGGEYIGVQCGYGRTPDQVLFNDPETKTTLAMPLGADVTPETVCAYIAASRERFAT